MIDNTKEYIACSAIYYDDGNIYPYQNIYGIKSGFVIGCFRHSTNPFPQNPYFGGKENDLEFPTKNTCCKVHQGFITSYGRYVDRKEALEIAIKANQVKKEECGPQLYSEDIFKFQKYRGE